MNQEFVKKYNTLKLYTDSVNDFYDKITKEIANVLLHKADSKLLAKFKHNMDSKVNLSVQNMVDTK